MNYLAGSVGLDAFAEAVGKVEPVHERLSEKARSFVPFCRTAWLEEATDQVLQHAMPLTESDASTSIETGRRFTFLFEVRAQLPRDLRSRSRGTALHEAV